MATTKQTTPPLASLDAKLDAVAGALKAALPELEIAIKEAIKASEHQRHALLHRIHRAAHDFVVIAAEARVSR